MTELRRSRASSCAATVCALFLVSACASGGSRASGSVEAGQAVASREPAVIVAADVPAGEIAWGGSEPRAAPATPSPAGPGRASRVRPGGARGSPDLDPRATAEERFQDFARQLLSLVNEDRRAAHACPLPVDPEAARFAQAEARRLVEEGRFDHHAADGSKPYQRWSRRGGTARVAENLYRLTAREGRAYMLFEPADAHGRLMRSPGHRRNVLDFMHTGAGIAVAFDAARNSVVVVEEFVDRYVAVEPGDRVWRAGESRELRGRVLDGSGLEPWLAVLYREPVSGSEAARREAARHSYTEGSEEAALVLSAGELGFDRASGEFSLRVRVPPAAAPGPYTLVLYVVPRERAARGAGRSSAGAAPVTQLAYEVVR